MNHDKEQERRRERIEESEWDEQVRAGLEDETIYDEEYEEDEEYDNDEDLDDDGLGLWIED